MRWPDPHWVDKKRRARSASGKGGRGGKTKREGTLEIKPNTIGNRESLLPLRGRSPNGTILRPKWESGSKTKKNVQHNGPGLKSD